MQAGVPLGERLRPRAAAASTIAAAETVQTCPRRAAADPCVDVLDVSGIPGVMEGGANGPFTLSVVIFDTER